MTDTRRGFFATIAAVLGGTKGLFARHRSAVSHTPITTEVKVFPEIKPETQYCYVTQEITVEEFRKRYGAWPKTASIQLPPISYSPSYVSKSIQAS